MADPKNNPIIGQYRTQNGTLYDLADLQAREDIKTLKGKRTFLGTTSTALKDGDTTSPITVKLTADGEAQSVTPEDGQYVIYGKKEFLWAAVDGAWHEYGDVSDHGKLAYKDSVTGTVTPSGTISDQTFTGTEGDIAASGTPTGKITETAFTGTEKAVDVTYDKIDKVTVTAAAPAEGETANYTPAGTVAVTPVTTDVKEVKDVGTLPTFSDTVEDGVLSFQFGQGTLPTTDNKTVVESATAAFTGTGAAIKATPTTAAATASGTFTPEGTVAAKFEGDVLNVAGKFTPEGTVSKATFKGDTATITSE